jgi:hypothetical protein
LQSYSIGLSCFQVDHAIPPSVTPDAADLMGVIAVGRVVDLEELLTNMRNLVDHVP